MQDLASGVIVVAVLIWEEQMSQKEVLEGRGVLASAGMVLYRHHEGEIEILKARRKTDPWNGYTSIIFGGLVKPTDESGLDTALREAQEETGRNLIIEVPYPFPIDALGPQSFHYLLRFVGAGYPYAVKTDQPISSVAQFVTLVYAGRVSAGEPRSTKEMGNFEWVHPLELAKNERELAFDQALVLQHFWELKFFHGFFKNSKICDWVHSSPV